MMDWFLYDNGLRLKKVNRYRHSNNILNAFLAYVPFFYTLERPEDQRCVHWV